jgi:hypothetical protein
VSICNIAVNELQNVGFKAFTVMTEKYYLLGYNSVSLDRSNLTFWRNVPTPRSGLKNEPNKKQQKTGFASMGHNISEIVLFKLKNYYKLLRWHSYFGYMVIFFLTILMSEKAVL